ncbi:MAG: phosphoenolpyruvate--protein phosphotransferase, partial [Candidatus Dadabacteria bacterium]
HKSGFTCKEAYICMRFMGPKEEERQKRQIKNEEVPSTSLEGVIVPNPVTKMKADLEGTDAAPGLVMGRAYVVPSGAITDSDKLGVRPEQIDLEVDKLKKAIHTTAEELSQADPSEHPILIPLANELKEDILPKAIVGIKELRLTAVRAVEIAFERYIEGTRVEHLKNEIISLRDNVISRLHSGAEYDTLRNLPAETIIVGVDFPAVALRPIGPKDNIIGMVTDYGGRHGHAAITATTLGWAAVTDCEEATRKIKTGDLLIVDGETGKVWINPDENMIKWYKREKSKRLKTEELIPIDSCSPRSLDGHIISLTANIDTAVQTAMLEAVFPNGMRKIGLFRTEEDLLQSDFSTTPLLLDEDRQFIIYKALVAATEMVVIRTVDHGGEKSLTGHKVRNPALGPRGIRFSLMRPAIFLKQLKAILRASQFGRVGIMIPMVTDAGEVVRTMEMIEAAKRKLDREGKPYNSGNVDFGVMIETPAAVAELEKILPLVDFISVGTNDLTQYLLAADRKFSPGDKEGRWERRFAPHHPTVVRALRRIMETAANWGVPASICGQIANEPFYIPLCLGAGCRYLSLSPRGASEVKRYIENVSIEDCRRLVDEIIQVLDPEVALELLKAFNHRITGRKPHKGPIS